MTASVTTSFIELFDAEVKSAYQREGSMLRKTVRQRAQVGATRIYFPRLGKGVATLKARNAEVVPMNLEHSRVFADMADFYAPEYLDELDAMKINWSVRSEYAKASAYALGRQTDQIIIDALNLTPVANITSAATVNGGGNTVFTNRVATVVSSALNSRDVPMDMRRWAVVTPDTLAELLQQAEATNSFFIREQLLITGQKPAFWQGYNWVVHTGLPATFNGAALKGFFYHEDSTGHGISKEVATEVNYVPERVSWLVNSCMSMGSVVIDSDGVQVLTV